MASAIATSSMILKLLDEAQLWLDLDGAEGDVSTIGTDFGVVGVVCLAVRDLEFV